MLHSIYQKESCSTMAFNIKSSYFAVQSNFLISGFQFSNGRVKQICKFNGHSDYLTTLTFFRQAESLLISSSEDSTIIFRSILLSAKPKFLFKLRGHSSGITSTLLTNNPKEDLIISASNDQSIKFWYYNSIQNNNSWKFSQEIKEHQCIVQELSMNPNSNTVISCGNDSLILIIQFCQIWQVKQKINLDEKGFRIKFIDNDFFIFQQLIYKEWSYCAGRKFMIYSLQNDGYYVKTQKCNIYGGGKSCHPMFPCSYIPSKNLLIVKNGFKVNILKMMYSDNQSQKSIKFEIKSVISFTTYAIFGANTQDGNYLAVYDSRQFLIQIFSLEQM